MEIVSEQTTSTHQGRSVYFEIEAGIAVLTLDKLDSSLNILTTAFMEELEVELDKLAGQSGVKGLIIQSAKPQSFIAGANIEEIAALTDKQLAFEVAHKGQKILHKIALFKFPTVAAINGVCLGGGLELALACNYRLSTDSPKVAIGLPEIRLGIIPGFGGTQRLPGVVGLANAFDLILTGKRLNALQAKRMGLVDEVVSDAKLIESCKRFLQQKRRRRRKQKLSMRLLEGNALGRKLIIQKVKAKIADASRHYPASEMAVKSIVHGLKGKIEDGLEFEARCCGHLIVSEVSKNLIHVFYLSESVKKRPEALRYVEATPIHKIGILGAGIMGGGIAHLFARKGIKVRLSDIAAESISKALGTAKSLLDRARRRKRISAVDARDTMSRIHPTIGQLGFVGVDVVVEAVVENIDIKKQVLADIESKVRDDAILATNTSSLSVDEMSTALKKPSRLVGMHFFNPVDRMPLIEVVRGEYSDPGAVASIYDLSLRAGKVPIIVRDRPGFLVNRLLGFYLREAMQLFEEGAVIEEIDRALVHFGMPMGPFELMDVVGLDVAEKAAKNLAHGLGIDRISPSPILQLMCQRELLGKKNNQGFYLYKNGKKLSFNSKVETIVGKREQSADASSSLGKRRLLWERPILLMFNEALTCLQEKLVESADKIDLAMIMGCGFPPFRGGLMRYGASMDRRQLKEKLEEFAASYGKRFTPHPELDAYLEDLQRRS